MDLHISYKTLIVCCLVTFTSWGQEGAVEAFRDITRRARKANKEGRYRDSLRIVDKNFQTKKRGINSPAMILLLQSDNYEKIGEYETSIRYLTYYINSEFKRFHRKILDRHQNKIGFSDKNVPLRLQKAYERKANLFAKLYLKKTRENPDDENKDFFKKVVFYNELCQKFPKNGCSKSQLLVEEARKFKAKRLKKSYFATSSYTLSYLLFSDDLKLQNTNTQALHDVAGVTHAACAGISYGYKNDTYEYNFQPCFYVGQSSLSEVDPIPSSANYSEVAAVYGTLVAFGIYGNFFGDKFPLGLSLAMRYRGGKYTDVTLADKFTITEDSNLSYGGFFESKYNYSKSLSAVFKVGTLTDIDAYIFALQLNYIRF